MRIGTMTVRNNGRKVIPRDGIRAFYQRVSAVARKINVRLLTTIIEVLSRVTLLSRVLITSLSFSLCALTLVP